MKSICLTNKNHDTPERNGANAMLTIGKIYEVKHYGSFHFDSQYGVTADTGHPIVVPKYYFKLIDEYRQEQIEKILECTTSSV
jgi:hypothetical protein